MAARRQAESTDVLRSPRTASTMESWANRVFDPAPEACGGKMRMLVAARLRITRRGVEVVRTHLTRFGYPSETPRETLMVGRLERLAFEPQEVATPWDRQFYAHELREFVRYRRLRIRDEGTRDDWNNAHTAALKDYGIVDAEAMLYHPSIGPPR
jgi:hypothetical protein